LLTTCPLSSRRRQSYSRRLQSRSSHNRPRQSSQRRRSRSIRCGVIRRRKELSKPMG